MNGQGVPAVRRVVVLIDPNRPLGALPEVATRVAADFGAELSVLYIEDPDLIRLASLSFTSELGEHTARSRQLDAEQLMRLWRQNAGRVESRFAAAAQSAGVGWSFRVERGLLLALLLEAAAEGSLVLSAEGQHARPVGARAGGRGLSEDGLILVVPGTPGEEARSLGFAQRYAAAGASAFGGAVAAAGRVWPLGAAGQRHSPDLREAIRRLQPSLLVIPADLARDMHEELRRLLRWASCGLLLHP